MWSGLVRGLRAGQADRMQREAVEEDKRRWEAEMDLRERQFAAQQARSAAGAASRERQKQLADAIASLNLSRMGLGSVNPGESQSDRPIGTGEASVMGGLTTSDTVSATIDKVAETPSSISTSQVIQEPIGLSFNFDEPVQTPAEGGADWSHLPEEDLAAIGLLKKDYGLEDDDLTDILVHRGLAQDLYSRLSEYTRPLFEAGQSSLAKTFAQEIVADTTFVPGSDPRGQILKALEEEMGGDLTASEKMLVLEGLDVPVSLPSLVVPDRVPASPVTIAEIKEARDFVVDSAVSSADRLEGEVIRIAQNESLSEEDKIAIGNIQALIDEAKEDAKAGNISGLIGLFGTPGYESIVQTDPRLASVSFMAGVGSSPVGKVWKFPMSDSLIGQLKRAGLIGSGDTVIRADAKEGEDPVGTIK